MANNVITMDSLKSEAVRVYHGMIAVFPQFSKEKVINMSEMTPKFNGCYATNNSTVCFVSDNEIFVIPYTSLVIRSLCNAGFRREEFYVPFSNWDYPRSEKFKWEALREKARQSYAEEFVEECASYCDEHHIGAISEETLQNCFEMPSTGVKVNQLYFEDCYYPIINYNCLDCIAIDRIGHFCANNGKVVFVYRNGKTYVAKGYKILKELCDEGYIESGLFVPFSNGEQIQDPVLRSRWESITKCQPKTSIASLGTLESALAGPFVLNLFL